MLDAYPFAGEWVNRWQNNVGSIMLRAFEYDVSGMDSHILVGIDLQDPTSVFEVNPTVELLKLCASNACQLDI
jgi:hypothetical protein